jgi:hypothetical protein
MVSKEGSDIRRGRTWSAKERTAIRTIFEGEQQKWEAIGRQREALSKLDVGVEYAKLVSELADGVWYRGYPGGSHEFALVLTDPNMETLHKAYRTEVDLQGKFPLSSFYFDLRSSLSAEDKTDLTEKGYKWVSGVENEAHQPPPK